MMTCNLKGPLCEDVHLHDEDVPVRVTAAAGAGASDEGVRMRTFRASPYFDQYVPDLGSVKKFTQPFYKIL